MSNIITKAKELLSNKTVKLVIGYQSGTDDVRPAFITNPDKTDLLIYNDKCLHNLSVYLTKNEVKILGKIAIFATHPVMRSILQLASEKQVFQENVIVIGIDNNGETLDFADFKVMQNYIEKSNLSNPEKDQKIIDELNKLSLEEKFKFWENELSKCIKCYACRQTCPMCYCTRCTTECNQPQWIPVQSNSLGNMEWHVLRAMHLAGRCVSCGECGRACPVDIPCHLLTMFLSEQVNKHFNVFAGTSDNMKSVMSTFEPNDKENFII